ncbi:MAG: Hsp20/alpha crystallin family protein [Verrucomicrobiales bacterium]
MNESNQSCRGRSGNTSLSSSEADPAQTSAPVHTAQPDWNASRDDTGVHINVTLPGVTKDDLQLEVEGRNLRLHASRKSAGKNRTLILGHEAPDAYALKLRLGESLASGSLTAALTDGILKISIPLEDEAKTRTIEIN